MSRVPVDVIIPVYGAPDHLERCLDSVVTHTDLTHHRILLVLDGPQEQRIDALAAPHASIRNPRRLGFVATVNRGMRESTRDVVLLNSDTLVTPRWLEKMSAAAASHERVGTVTPFSNNATLVSVPEPFEENLLPAGFDAASFAALVERVSVRDYPRLPTAVGFCMYIRRALLDDVGFFDETRFGHGYGEENDFSLRATERGWLHLLDDATFVYHAGARSFGAEARTHRRRGAATLRRLHPQYLPAIARFMREDPLAPARARITGTRQRKRVAHLVHGWPPFARGGVESYAQWLVRAQLRHRDVAVYARLADPTREQGAAVELRDGGARVRLVTNNFLQRDPFSRNALRDRALAKDFARFLRAERPELLHVHHTAGHAFPLVRVARRLGIPIVQSLHDWWPLCARVNLFDVDGRRCSGPALTKCARCVTLTRIPLANVPLHAYRRLAARAALAQADAFVMPSNAIRDDFARERILPRGTPVHVIPYGIDLAARTQPRPPARLPLRFGCVGAVLPHKGLHLADAVFADIDPSRATLHVWGNANADAAYTRTLRNATLEATFADDEKQRVFDSLDVLLMPSIGLESYGLVAREAMARGVAVLAANDGALAEIDGAMHFRSGDVASLRETIVSLIDDPSRIPLDLPQPKSAAAHADEIEAVYAAVLEARRR
jgi:GT2 family glycosyltransferase/glycosyltransferase involved in cell wall biosynthesis